MNIRRAVATDALALAVLERRQPLAAGWGEKGFASELIQPAARIWCAEEAGILQGFLALRFAAENCEILNVAVCPTHVRKGIGWKLLEHALLYVKQQGVQRVSLEAAEHNQPASKLYTKAGFCIVGRRKNFYGAGQDALIWGKDC